MAYTMVIFVKYGSRINKDPGGNDQIIIPRLVISLSNWIEENNQLRLFDAGFARSLQIHSAESNASSVRSQLTAGSNERCVFPAAMHSLVLKIALYSSWLYGKSKRD